MTKLFLFLALFASFAVSLHAQNLTTVSASNLQDINGVKLAAGQLCFLITDQNDNPLSVQVGGGGQALKRGYCTAVTNGTVTSFTVPNPASTLPSGIYYRVTVKDTTTGQEVLRYTQVSFTGGTFNFDGYAPLNLANPAPLSGTSVTGNLSVTGNVAATGSVIGSNIPGSIPGAGACANQLVRALNSAAPPTCATVGSADLAASLALTTPNIGAATASSLTNNGNESLASTSIVKWSTDTGLSRAAAGTVAVGNGTQGDASGTLNLQNLTASGLVSINGSIGLPAATGASLYLAGNFGTPHLGKVFLGDGTGWQLDFSKRAGSATTDLLSFKDNGQIIFLTTSGTLPATIANDTAGGITVTSNSGKVNRLIDNSGVMYLGTTGSPGTLLIFGNTSGFTTLQAQAAASGGLTLPSATDTLVGKATTDTLTNKTLSSPVITSPTVNTGVAQGSGLKHQRFGATCTTGGADGQQCGTTYTWTSAFADANYTASCTLTATTTNSPTIIAISKTATQIQIVIGATSAVAASAPGVDCIAIHD